ncbi:sensor histidine kinase [Pseudonocardia spinosispora]|uniref:sensor histidine kinase n=1 Tax=Pseudonocardia spinosispora TaxID=103441 RepID=UPI00041B23C2|nr:sensor histidine kinase [Pseudonocardia spinosispora]
MLGSGVISRLRFSRQIFVLQTALVALLIALVAALTGWLLRNTLTDEYGERALAIARVVASDPEVIAAVAAKRQGGALQSEVVSLTGRTEALFVVVTDANGIRLAHPAPDQVGKPVSTSPAEALAGREVVSVVQEGTLGRSVRSKTPVFGAGGAVVGEVSVGYAVGVPGAEINRLLVIIGVFAVVSVLLGLAASWLLSGWLRRLTHGVEPRELTEMLYEHEAVLHGVGEGVLAVDADQRISVRNAEAERLLGVDLPIGSRAAELPVSPRVRLAIAESPMDNVLAVAGNRVIVVNSRRVRRDDHELGTVLTLRDRTDLDMLTSELDSIRSLTDGLRAQRHEYSNRLHTLSGLLQLGHRAEAIEYLQALTDSSGAGTSDIDASVHDPYLGALLLAKSEQAEEKGVALRLSDDSSLTGEITEPVTVTTVLGNLLDNALRAANLGSRRPAWIELTLLADGSTLHLSVQDSGPGVAEELRAVLFDEGTTTKITPGHGLGLALARHEARSLGGDLWLAQAGDADTGALFVAALPGVLSRPLTHQGGDR